jgi:5-(carboxyamino)imidazole ribonucleotide synthase
MSVILPGGTLGILGGGQLGRMTAMAARSLGYHLAALDPDPSCAARFVVEACITAGFDDVAAARELARQSQVVTVEIEKVAVEALRAVQELVPMRPGPEVLFTIQDRARQKDWLLAHGFPVGPYRKAGSEAELREALRAVGGKAYVKTSRGAGAAPGDVGPRGQAPVGRGAHLPAGTQPPRPGRARVERPAGAFPEGAVGAR